ncbi:DMT family transporter [Alcanivorax sediminis]|uniref:Guanidinium exporter n=1 Tax=Alcanivorax sediminis TaxID=2663008 RepID=A0A6N7LZS3_9GAMM|nr:multidrug efflux SMR transporter [Alcanivorax sediminis]MQX54694.1 QacE family quaternary ammonium compound efflux SMR transporter [Alcanivorax sediminis]
MAWVYIFFAGLLEIGWALGLKASEGFTRPLITFFTLITAAASFWLLSQAMREPPAGTAYAVWSGIGAFGTVLLGIVFFQDTVSAGKLACLLMIVAGIVGVKIFS